MLGANPVVESDSLERIDCDWSHSPIIVLFFHDHLRLDGFDSGIVLRLRLEAYICHHSSEVLMFGVDHVVEFDSLETIDRDFGNFPPSLARLVHDPHLLRGLRVEIYIHQHM